MVCDIPVDDISYGLLKQSIYDLIGE